MIYILGKAQTITQVLGGGEQLRFRCTTHQRLKQKQGPIHKPNRIISKPELNKTKNETPKKGTKYKSSQIPNLATETSSSI